VERPKEREKERLHYSGKRRRPTCMASIVVNEYGVIRGVTESAPGRTHDLTQIRQSGHLTHIPTDVIVVADSGYDGLYKNLPDHSVATAHKAQRNHPLQQAHKDMNRELSSIRIIVENVFCQLKHFKCLCDCFRHDVIAMHSAAFMTIAAIVTRQTMRRFEMANVR
jgi:IS5 family transposase